MKKLCKALLSCAMVLSLFGCDEEVVVQSWKTGRPLVYGTLSLEEDIGVAIEVEENKLNVYYDSDNQVLLQELYFGSQTYNVDYTFDSIDIYDVNDDGYSDITAMIEDSNGNQYEQYFIYSTYDEIYVLDPNISGFSNEFFISYIDNWYLAGDLTGYCLVIDAESGWCIYDPYNKVFAYGYVGLNNDETITLYLNSGDIYADTYIEPYNDNGLMIDLLVTNVLQYEGGIPSYKAAYYYREMDSK